MKLAAVAALAAFIALVIGSATAAPPDDLAQSWALMKTSSPYTKWASQNPGEKTKLETYWSNCGTFPVLATAFGQALALEGKAYCAIKPAPPPPAKCANSLDDDGDGKIDYPADPGCSSASDNDETNPSGTVTLSWDGTEINYPPWDAMFTYSGTPDIGPGVQGSPDGRVQIVTAPDGVGKALRTEMRDSDPPWPYNADNDRAHLSANAQSTWGTPNFTVGDIYWFDFELWLPLNNPVGAYFDYPRNDWYRLWEMHDGWGAYWSCFSLISDGLPANNAWMPLRLAGGGPPQSTPPEYFPLFQLTNADGSWHTQNFNRRIHIRYGGRLAPDNTGWFEAYVDGVQVIPRTQHATMWQGDTAAYLVPGQYKRHGDPFPHYGKSVVYFMNMKVEKGA